MSLSDSKNETNTAGSLFHVKGFQLEILSLDGAIEYRVKKIRKRQHLGPQDGVVVLVVAFFLVSLIKAYSLTTYLCVVCSNFLRTDTNRDGHLHVGALLC